MKTFQDLVQEALKTIPEIDIFQLKEKIDNKKVIKLIDIREDREWVSGRIPAAIHAGRGILEKSIPEIAAADDEMALFMNGNQSLKTWFKIIYSLPKLLFLQAIWQCIKEIEN